MNEEDVFSLAEKAGLGFVKHADPKDIVKFKRFAALVASAERERILDICKEGLWDAEGIRYHLDNQDRGQA